MCCFASNFHSDRFSSQIPDLRRVRSFKLRQEEWYGSLPGHTASRHRSVQYSAVQYSTVQYRTCLILIEILAGGRSPSLVRVTWTSLVAMEAKFPAMITTSPSQYPLTTKSPGTRTVLASHPPCPQ